MTERRERGDFAEDIALEYLKALGLVLLHRNWRCKHKEIDLIMMGWSYRFSCYKLHIIEVRSLTEPVFMLPFESVDKKKQRLIMSAASGYISQNNIAYETQFDIVSVLFSNNEEYRVEYFPDAFTPVW